MITLHTLEAQSRQLAFRSGKLPIYDLRMDGDDLDGAPQRTRHAKHLALLRSYQGRYVLLPGTAPGGSIVEALMQRYDPRATHALDALRADLEDELVGPILRGAAASVAGVELLPNSWADFRLG